MSMSRERQRELGALRVQVERLRSDGYSTVPATIHVSADTLDVLESELFRDYTAKQRRRMASEGRAMPDGSFPIGTCQDAEDAIHAQGRAKDQKKAVAHIRKRVRALRCSGQVFDKYR